MPYFTEYILSGGQEFEHSSSVYYVGVQGRLDAKRDSELSSARANLEQKLYASGTWRKLRIRVAQRPGMGSAVLRLKNQSETLATATIGSGLGAFTYEADVDQALNSGDTLYWEIDPSSTSGAKLEVEWIALELEVSSDTSPIDLCAGGLITMIWGPPLIAEDQFMCVQGDLRNGAIEADANGQQSRAGTIGPARVRIVQHQIGTATLHLLKNGTSQFSTTISDSGPETREFGSPTDFAFADELEWKLSFDGGGSGDTDALSYIVAKVIYT